MSYQAFYHPHAYFWIVLVSLFFISFFLYKKNVAKGAKITHMILRLFYVIMIVTGIGLLSLYGFPFTYLLKGIVAISLIYFMEMILVKTKKGTADGKTIAYYWIMCLVTLMLVILIGYEVITF